MNGFICDIGAPKSVVGRKELNRIFNAAGTHNQKIFPSRNRFRFADSVFESRGRVTIPLRTPSGVSPVMVELDIVDADIPALLGMDVLDKESLTPCTITNRLIHRTPRIGQDGKERMVDVWSVPLVRSGSNHLYAAIESSTPLFFTRSQLVKLHRQFFHPSAQKLFNVMKRARPEEATQEKLEVLKQISARCDPCQRIQHAPTRFRVTLGAEELRFNERIMMDIMYIDGDPVLHIVDEATRFSAASYIADSSTNTVWETILKCWASIYTGLPNRIMTDRGSQFKDKFIDLARKSDVEVNRTGVEARSSLGLCERYHEPLRNTVRKIKIVHPNAKKDVVLSCAVKAMNDSLGPEGLVPSSLVFGEFPRVRTSSEPSSERPTLSQRSSIAELARKEMNIIMAEQRLKRAMHHSVPPATDRAYEPGDKVLVWKEKVIAQRIGEWLGPFEVISADYEKKLVYVRDAAVGPARPLNVVQIKPYLSDETLSRSFLCDINRSLGQYKTPSDEAFCFMTEVINSSDERACGKAMSDAKKQEIRSLLERGTFKVILKEDIPPDGNVLPGRFVLAIKSTIDGQTKYKARYVIGGHRDRMKDWMVHSSTTIQPQSVRLLLALTSMLGFDLWTADIRQAYLQTSEPFLREVFIDKPVAEFELEPGECLQLLKPLYGLCDAGDLWHATLDKHHRLDLKMIPFRIDPALYYLRRDGRLQGLSGSYVDDLIRAGNASFRKESEKTRKKFEMSEETSLPSEFTGFVIDRDKDCFFIDQNAYLRKLECLSQGATFSHFRSMRMKLAWLANSRPDCLFEISQLSQVTEVMFEKEKGRMIRRLNKAVKYAVDNRTSLLVPKLSLESLKVVGFSDSSFANNPDMSSQVGHVVFLCDGTGKAAPIVFKSYKARRVTRSALSGEVIAVSDMFDAAISISQELSAVLGKVVPVQLLTDSKSLFDVISKGSRTSEKRTMLDVAAAREGFRDKIISDIGFVRSASNIADGLTKEMSQAALRDVIVSGYLEVAPEMWIIRKD